MAVYETIGDPIGEGAFGKVYRGRDRIRNTEVAIKIIEVSDAKMLNHPEIQGLDQLRSLHGHPNVVKYLDVKYPAPNRAAIVMEFCDGNLEQHYLETNVNFASGVDLMRQCLKGLKYLHDNDIVHRDLKPENILMKAGIPKISDFGVAKLADLDPVLSKKYMSTMCGTPNFVAPEILSGRPYTQLVDIYSMGVTFSWMNDNGGVKCGLIRQLALKMASDNPSDRPSISYALERLDTILKERQPNNSNSSNSSSSSNTSSYAGAVAVAAGAAVVGLGLAALGALVLADNGDTNSSSRKSNRKTSN